MNKKIKITSSLVNLRVVENAIEEVNNKIGIPKKYFGKIMVSTMEAVNNAILHGNNSDPHKIVEVNINFNGERLLVKVSDEGNGFRPDNVPDPTGVENVIEPNGRGVFIMSKLADKIRYNKKGNEVSMTFKNIIS